MTPNGTDTAAGYAAALGALSRVLVDGPSLRATLDQLMSVAVVAAPHVTALTVTAVAEDGELTAAAWTVDEARSVDEFEYAIDEGPCITALETGEEQLVRDASTDERWPRFAARAVEEGFRSIAGLPLRAPDGTVIGALNVFGAEADGLAEADLAVLRRVCEPAAAVLANARAYRRTSQLGEELASVLDERAIVNRAIGVLLGRHGGTPDEAFGRLQATATREGTTLLDVADRVVNEDIIDLDRRTGDG